jgi:hypothetical protein
MLFLFSAFAIWKIMRCTDLELCINFNPTKNPYKGGFVHFKHSCKLSHNTFLGSFIFFGTTTVSTVSCIQV